MCKVMAERIEITDNKTVIQRVNEDPSSSLFSELAGCEYLGGSRSTSSSTPSTTPSELT